MKTGDILLFDETPTNSCMRMLDNCIKYCTHSHYSHSAIVIVNPPWDSSLKGTYVWESSFHGTKDPQDGKVKFGVQLTPLDLYTKRYPGRVKIYCRTPETPCSMFTDAALIAIHKRVYDKPYDIDPCDWLHALFRCFRPRRTDTYYCSAFVSYVLTSVGVLAPDTDWTIISPAELSASSENRLVIWRVKYGQDKRM